MAAFHPIIQHWFNERYGEPTDIQSVAWPRIADGSNLLITAPTGSGKTLTAFLWSLNRFATGELETGTTRILYISPLKALNNDIRRNLLEPLGQLRDRFTEAGEAFPEIKVQTRSGDTEPEERRRMLRHPPEILITTPESLNLLLSSHGGQNLLYEIDTVILDEIHGVVDSKRGVYLMSAVERVAALSGEFQRIALSATVNPLDAVADFVAGYELNNGQHRKRSVDILQSRVEKQYEISIRYPELAAVRGDDDKIWNYLADDMLPRIEKNRSTLIFVNSRALCEKLTFKLNDAAGRIVAYAHHGSLSRELRATVEERLKAGSLEAIVATSSLEMGIDIGALDEVILVQSPGSIASSIQRIGRAGHQVGAASRCTIYPTHPQDFIEAAVLAESVQAKALEPVKLIAKPLDVLGQVIISMTGLRSWDLDELFDELRRSTPYGELTRTEFELVLNMLTGRYADRHIRELKPRVRIDRTANTIEARKGALLSLYLSGGVIPDRGYFQLRHESDNARIGELDEEFVWEANVGQTFSLGTQTWQVKKITHNDVIVGPGKAGASAPPFWKAEPINRSFHYAERINQFLENANANLEDDEFRQSLITHHHAEPDVADEIISFLKKQKEHTHTDLPHRHHLLFEHIESGPGRAAGRQLVIHTGWGAEVNRPFGMALEAAIHQEAGEQPEVFIANESLVIQLIDDLSASDILGLVPPHRLEELLRTRLEGSGFFGARFRENAGRSLLLSKGRFNERKPLWMSRLQSQKLLESVLKYEDFPILLETWRTCLRDEFDLVHLRQMLDELDARDITISEIRTAAPSPFAQTVAWDQVNTYMYMTDAPKSAKSSNLSEELLRQVVYSPDLRPALDSQVVAKFTADQQRLSPGYEPRDNVELEDWLKERTIIPAVEWQTLCSTLDFEPETGRFRFINDDRLVASIDDADAFQQLLTSEGDPGPDLEVLISNWLQYYGPISLAEMADRLGLPESLISPALGSLVDDDTLVQGPLIEGDEQAYFCDARNYEYLIRLQRAASRPEVVAKNLDALAPFMYCWQTHSSAAEPADRLFELIDRLRGLPLPAALWEADVLPARIQDYDTRLLDALFQEGEIEWLGLGERQVTFCFGDDLDLVANPAASDLLPETLARYDFNGLLDKTGLPAAELAEKLWQEVWQTRISNDSVVALRKGIQNDFKPAKVEDTPSAGSMRRGRRGAFNRWRGSMPWTGNWYAVAHDDSTSEDLDLLEQQELDKDRARLMLSRYGIVFRELCTRESDNFTWYRLFRALRLMELSGEVVSGHFFKGIPGPQFMTPAAVRLFQEPLSKIFFINAADPVSPSGLGLGIHGDQLPRRVPSSYLVYHDDSLVATVSRRGRELNFLVPPDSDRMADYLQVLHHLCYRSFDPVRQLAIETINGEAAAMSPYLPAIEQCFNIFRDHKSLRIQREI